ncbi:aldose epimerase family protein [Fulvivirgaceae bacterium BMA12]|uniref:Aldose 1-epimerase n=1 Tax=Agaribacillus aureus TaxID=3051825 RepID=A0ABT8KZF1_9BACT|nr:aldose epimerase family protein [Fulvivirgaceae bacterium BMA12]
MSLMCTVEKSIFGKTPQGEVVRSFLLRHKNGLAAKVLDFGGILNALYIKDPDGNAVDVVLGFEDVRAYLKEDIYAGALVGRIAGRLSNGRFTMQGKTYQLPQNEGSTHLHGGVRGFDKRLWEAKIRRKGKHEALELTLHSPNGEEGYPGNLDVTVTYSLSDENGIRIDMEAKTDHPTPFCPTSHAYFNLAGEGVGDICDHILQIDADTITEMGASFLPTGNMVKTTPGINDFTQAAPVRKIVKSSDQVHGAMYKLNASSDGHQRKAMLQDQASGRTMHVYTNAPGIQLYTGSGLNTRTRGKSGVSYGPFAGICLECQGFSDAPHHPQFEPIWLYPNEPFFQYVEYRFEKKTD